MSNGIGTATRILLVNTVVAVFALAAQVTSLALYGPTHSYWFLYVTLMGLMFVVSLVSQWIVRKSLTAGMQFYAWTCFACVGGMVCVDGTVLCDGFPVILHMLILGVLGLGMTVGYTSTIPYAAICSLATLYAGIMYNSVDSAIVAVALMAATTVIASEASIKVKQLDELERAVDVYTKAKLHPDRSSTEWRQDQ